MADQHRLVLATTILGSSMVFIDGAVVTIALPAMGQDLQAGFAEIQWVVNAYLLMLASLMLLGGALGDRIGRRKVFSIGLWGFALASAACGIAPTALVLIGARAVQGIAAALLTPASLALIGEHFSGEDRGKAIGTWAAAASLTSALGPVLGGWIVEAVGWRWIFYANLPMAALTLVLASRVRSRAPEEAKAPLDYAGSMLAIATLGLLCAGLITIGQGDRTTGSIELALSVPAAIGFIWRQRTAANPLVPLTLFRDRNFSGANLLTIVLYAAMSAVFVVLPVSLIQSHGYSPAQAGAAMLPMMLIMGVLTRSTGALATRVGSRIALTVGPLLAGIGCALLAWLPGDGSSYAAGFLPGEVVLALGMAIAVPPLTTTVLDAVEDRFEGTASGINNVAARAGGLLAVAALGLAVAGGASSAGAGGIAAAYGTAMSAAAVLAFVASAVGAAMIKSAPSHR